MSGSYHSHPGAGFTHTVIQTQAAFRALMDALARPGTILQLPPDLAPPAPLTAELAAVALTMADREAPIWLDPALSRFDAVARYLRFHTGARIVDDPADSAFALVGEPIHMPDLDHFSQGSEDYPDRSTTIVVALERLEAVAPDTAGAIVLEGPGIRERAALVAAPLPAGFHEQLRRNRARYPRGVDCLFACAGQIAAIPRSSTILEGA